MAKQQDLVVKMTINSQDFDAGLKNAKSSMKNFDKDSGLSALTKKIGALGLALKAVDVAKDTFIKGINSTEQSADSAASSMRSLTKSYDAVIQALANGNTGFALTIDNLAQIAKNAKAAYEALDKLGTFQMWSSADRSIINAQIAEDRVIVNSKTATDEEKKAAQGRIDANVKRLEGLTQQYLTNTKNAQVSVLRELGKATEDVTDEMLAKYVESWKRGTLEAEAAAFREANSFVATRSFTMIAGDQTWQQEQQYDVWNSPQAQAQYQAMRALAVARETDEGWGEYFKLVKEEGQIRAEIANTVNKANKASQKTLTDVKSTDKTNTTTASPDLIYGRTIEEWLSIHHNKAEKGLLNTLQPYQPLGIPEEEIFEPETEALTQQIADNIERMKTETQAAITAASQLGNAFSSLGQIADGTIGAIFSALGSVISQISATVSAMMTLAGAETVEGIADLFANTKGGLFTKLAVSAAGLAGVMGIIASAKSAFAGSYANGGIVGGTSYTGDKLWARVNSGEMIIPKKDWSNGIGVGGQVSFVIEGSQLKGVLDNYEKIQNL